MNISICIATFNVCSIIDKCLQSILNQNYDNYEVIIADGGSTDGTLEKIADFNNDRIKLFSEKDKGISDAWNKAIKQAQGEWLYFLGADDCLADNTVLSEMAKKLNGVDSYVVYGNVNYVDANGVVINKAGNEWDAYQFKHSGMTFCHQGVFHHRKLFEEYGYFDLSLRICADYELLLRYLKDHNAHYVPDLIVADVAYGGISTVDGNAIDVFREYKTVQKRHLIFWGSMKFYRAYYAAVLKKVLVKILGKSSASILIDKVRPWVGRPKRNL